VFVSERFLADGKSPATDEPHAGTSHAPAL
jgi:hypothetical protein